MFKLNYEIYIYILYKHFKRWALLAFPLATGDKCSSGGNVFTERLCISAGDSTLYKMKQGIYLYFRYSYLPTATNCISLRRTNSLLNCFYTALVEGLIEDLGPHEDHGPHLVLITIPSSHLVLITIPSPRLLFLSIFPSWIDCQGWLTFIFQAPIGPDS